MVLMAPVLEKALAATLSGGESELSALASQVASSRGSSGNALTPRPWVVALTPQGRPLTAARVRELAAREHLVIVCGHYEGMDERFVETYVHEEISIGDYVLTGGEPAALVLMDAVSRFIPGVVGTQESVQQDSFESCDEMVPGGLKAPNYTRPQIWLGKAIPEVLTSGNHGQIRLWRRAESLRRTAERRPDLLSPKSPKRD